MAMDVSGECLMPRKRKSPIVHHALLTRDDVERPLCLGSGFQMMIIQDHLVNVEATSLANHPLCLGALSEHPEAESVKHT